jgi:Zn-dependent peptidase ImmA (M78 family)
MINFKGVITQGILLSHNLQKINNTFYDNVSSPKSICNIPQINTDKLALIIKNQVEKIYQIPKLSIIAKYSEDLPNGNLYGYVVTKNDIATIVINKGLNKCWERFTLCKELLQLYFDYQDGESVYSSEQIINQLDHLINNQKRFISTFKTSVKDYEIEFSNDSASELIAYIMAIDLIFPIQCRIELEKNYEEVLNGKLTFYDIAYSFKMPENIIKFYFSHLNDISKSLIKD